MALAAAAFGRETDTADRLGEISRETESLILGPYRGAINHTQTFLIMGHDGSDGKIRLDRDRLAIDWPGIGQRPVFRRIARSIRAAVAATGGTYVPNPLWSKTLGNQLVTVHPLGAALSGMTHRPVCSTATAGSTPGIWETSSIPTSTYATAR